MITSKRLPVTLLCVVLFSMLFGIPHEMQLREREEQVRTKCLVGDEWVDDLKAHLAQRQPELVLIGNSMLGEGVDQEKLSEYLQIPALKVWYGGTGSAWWYLALKNVIVQLEKKPVYVGIFFRDNYLTLPNHKVYGKHREAIDNFAGENEVLLDQLAYYTSMSNAELYLNTFVPVVNQSSRLKYQAESLIQGIAADISGLDTVSAVQDHINTAFDNNRMNQEMLHRRQLADELAQDEYKKNMSFKPERTFLKHIIDICKQNNISLFFVRVKRLKALNHPQEKELITYMRKLRSYLAENHVHLLDFTEDQRIVQKHFGRGDHLNRGVGRAVFTSFLAEGIRGEVLDTRELAQVQQ